MRTRTKRITWSLAVLLALALGSPPPAKATWNPGLLTDPNCVAVYLFETTSAGPTIVASASTERSSTYAAWKAFDSDKTTTDWSTSNGNMNSSWLMYSYGAGYERVVTTYSIMCTANVDAAPNTFTFDGYDGATYTTLDSQAGQTKWGSTATRTFTFANTTAYRAYRLSVTTNDGDAAYTEIMDLGLYSNTTSPNRYVLLANSTAMLISPDSKGSNHLTDWGVDDDAVNYKQGVHSGDWEYSNGDGAVRLDADLSAGFPWKSGTTNYSFSCTCWVRPESISSSYYYIPWSKNMTVWGGGHDLALFGTNQCFRVQLDKGIYGVQSPSVTVTPGQWYFTACTWDGATGAGRLYMWDDTAQAILVNATQTSAPATYGYPLCTAGGWCVGTNDVLMTFARPYDGNIDEMTVWNRALSETDIGKIKDGTYTYGNKNVNDWWWRRRHGG